MWPFNVAIDAINGIYQLIVSLTTSLQHFVISLVMALLYPVLLIINLLYDDINVIYTLIAQFINLIIGIPNLVLTMQSNWLPSTFPSIWTYLMMMSIIIAVSVRVSRLVKYLRGWVPIVWGG